MSHSFASSAALLSPSARPSSAPLRPSAVARADRKVAGILCILGATICFPLSDLAAQSLMTTLPPLEVAWLRYCVYVAACLPLLLRGRAAFHTARPVQQILRGTMTAISTMAALAAFAVLPVAESTAIGFVAPVFVTALAVIVLQESVGPRRWTAAAVALIGVMIIVRPGAASFQPAALLPLTGAVAAAIAVICTRSNTADDPSTTVLYTALTGTVIMTLVAAPHAVLPAANQINVLLVVGVFGAAGSVLQAVGYRLAPASTLAPFTYLQLIWVSGLAFLVRGQLPQATTIVGASLIAASAIYTAVRERAHGVA